MPRSRDRDLAPLDEDLPPPSQPESRPLRQAARSAPGVWRQAYGIKTPSQDKNKELEEGHKQKGKERKKPNRQVPAASPASQPSVASQYPAPSMSTNTSDDEPSRSPRSEKPASKASPRSSSVRELRGNREREEDAEVPEPSGRARNTAKGVKNGESSDSQSDSDDEKGDEDEEEEESSNELEVLAKKDPGALNALFDNERPFWQDSHEDQDEDEGAFHFEDRSPTSTPERSQLARSPLCDSPIRPPPRSQSRSHTSTRKREREHSSDDMRPSSPSSPTKKKGKRYEDSDDELQSPSHEEAENRASAKGKRRAYEEEDEDDLELHVPGRIYRKPIRRAHKEKGRDREHHNGEEEGRNHRASEAKEQEREHPAREEEEERERKRRAREEEKERERKRRAREEEKERERKRRAREEEEKEKERERKRRAREEEKELERKCRTREEEKELERKRRTHDDNGRSHKAGDRGKRQPVELASSEPEEEQPRAKGRTTKKQERGATKRTGATSSTGGKKATRSTAQQGSKKSSGGAPSTGRKRVNEASDPQWVEDSRGSEDEKDDKYKKSRTQAKRRRRQHDNDSDLASENGEDDDPRMDFVWHGSNRPNLSDLPPRVYRIAVRAIRECEVNACLLNAFPDEDPNCTRPVLVKHAKELGFNDILAKLKSNKETDEVYHKKLGLIPAHRVFILRGKVKKLCQRPVKSAYGLTVGDAAKVKWLLDGIAYIYPHDYEARTVVGEEAFDLPIFEDMLADAFFSRRTSFGYRIVDHFTSSLLESPDEKEIPAAMLALVSTAIYASIDDYKSPRYEAGRFEVNQYLDAYQQNIGVLDDIKAGNVEAYHKLMHGLFMRATGGGNSRAGSKKSYLNVAGMAQR